MYFDENELNTMLLCKKCNGRLNEPRILPCGESVCSYCVSTIQVQENKFNCLICSKKHTMPDEDLPISKLLSTILSLKPIELSRGTEFELLTKSKQEIQKKLAILKSLINNSDDFIKEYCIDLKNDVQLKTEQLIEQINEFSSEIISNIDIYEKENKQNKSVSLSDNDEIVKELELFCEKTTSHLNQFQINESDTVHLNKQSISLNKKAELEIQKLHNLLLNGNILKFKSNETKLTKSIIGEIFLSRVMNHSVILPDEQQFLSLMNLCEFSPEVKWQLSYRASQDGFRGVDFHAKCDYKPNSFVIIRSENGNVFGGFTEKTWKADSPTGYKSDPNAFIFSFINLDKKPLKIKCSNTERAIYGRCEPLEFGDFDLYISDKSNTNTESKSNLGKSYNHPVYRLGSDKAQSFLAGSPQFQVSEIEVYTKQ